MYSLLLYIVQTTLCMVGLLLAEMMSSWIMTVRYFKHVSRHVASV